MVHLSRLAEEITWWSNPAFGFVRVADAFSTGSSMMPNKRNPDPAELIRGKTARAIAALTAVLALLKGLPLGYQRDLQEDKPPLFGGVAGLEASLGVMAGLLDTLRVDGTRMREAAEYGHTTATAAADTLVRRGVPFRVAHQVVGSLVAGAEKAGKRLTELDDKVVSEALSAVDDPVARRLATEAGIGQTLRSAATVEAALESCDVEGGTAPKRVRGALAAARSRLDKEAAPPG
jgi:argininosuccinate lyase